MVSNVIMYQKKGMDDNGKINNKTSIYYRQLGYKVDDFRHILSNFDFRECLIYLPDSKESLVCLLALNREGKNAIPISSRKKGEALLYEIIGSQAQFIITDEKGLDQLFELSSRIKSLTAFVLHSCGVFSCETVSAIG
ncbi:MAG: hypothetical protein Q8920_14575 [Bacillota bacterium]|nr:hypothetical protein [Bacillota bacterium]